MHGLKTIPQIYPNVPLAEEADDLSLLNGSLEAIDSYATNFRNAVHLFEYCLLQASVLADGHLSAFVNWQRIAARDGVMSIWHYRQSMLAANTIANTSAYVGPLLNKAELREAHSKFERYFPEFDATRNAVAHAGEMAKSKEAFDRNAFKGDYESALISLKASKGMVISDLLQGKTFTSTTFGGKIVHCEISLTLLSSCARWLNTFTEPSLP
jgi:hypothetical protein